MPDLNQAIIFAKVVERKSFTAAARELELPKGTVSRKVMQLEERLGTRLLQRSTRRISLAKAGAVYYECCSKVGLDLAQAEAAIVGMRGLPRGTLRVMLPIGFGVQDVSPVLPEFLARYPEVRLSLVFFGQDRTPPSPIGDGIDVVIYLGPSHQFNCPGRLLIKSPVQVYASPSYLRQRGRPAAVADLADHPCITPTRWESHGRYVWQLGTGKQNQSVVVKPVLASNNAIALVDAALAGLGVVLIGEYFVEKHLKSHHLVRVLAPWSAGSIEFMALYPSRLGVPPKVRVFLDFLLEKLSR